MIVPAGTQPLKGDVRGPTPAQRLDMVEQTFGRDPRFEVSAMEIERGGLSYTVDTLEALSARHPGSELVLLLGLDALEGFPKWKNPARIRELARIAVLYRAGVTGAPAGGQASSVAGGMAMVTTRRLDVSSSEIRSRARSGRPIRGFVVDSVEEYISAAKLYRA